jgi:hypothetical protein
VIERLVGPATGEPGRDGSVPWDHAELARAAIAGADGPLRDLGTGGGEFLATLDPFPPGSAATEGWPRASREQSPHAPPLPRTECGSTPCRPMTRPGCPCPTQRSPSYLRMVPDFDVARYDAPLRDLHAAFERGEQIRDVAPRFILSARRDTP